MTLRYTLVTFYPRVQKRTERGAMSFAPDMDSPIKVRMGLTGDRANRAEVRGDVEIEVYSVRFPMDRKGDLIGVTPDGKPTSSPGVGPGARVLWDGTEWDIVSPPFLRPTRTHSTRHLTTQIRRRPQTRGGSHE